MSHSGAIIGNVQPPERYPPLGHLVFDATFESGNLGRVDELSTDEYDLFIRPDTCNQQYRVWFYFSVENMQKNQQVVFNLVNFSKLRCLFDKGCAAPVYREAGAENDAWRVIRTRKNNKFRNRISINQIYYYKSKAHANRFILSFVYLFRNSVRYEFAYCVPYTYTRLQRFLKRVDDLKLSYYRRDPLCNSVQKRCVDLLTISTPKNLHASKQKIVFMTARVHPGETPSSHVLEGFIEFLLSDDERAKKLRSLFIFKIVPMLNPDGVCLGNYRCSLMGFDLNRQWQHPSVWAHPSIAATKSLLLQFNTNPHMEVVLCFDLHAHSQRTNSFLYGNLIATSPGRRKRQLFIPHILSELTDDYSLLYTNFNTDIYKAGTNRRTMGELLDATCLCYTFEVSFFSYRPKDSNTENAIPYFEGSYKLLGGNLAVAILKYAEVLNDELSIKLSRAFESFLSRKVIKNFRMQQQQQRLSRSLSLHAK